MAFDISALQEAFRRRAGQQPSSAGIPGGASMANQQTPQNPLAALASKSSIQSPAGLGGGAPSGSPQPGSMTQPAREQLEQSRPGERELIIKALIRVLRETGPEGGQPQKTA